MKKGTIAALILAAVILAGGLTVLALVNMKVILLNRWFVNEEESTIGADISAYQAQVDMEKLKEQGIAFVYIKATEGSSHRDKMFRKNWRNAKKAGIPSGAYHFFSYDSPGESQAENFIRFAGEDMAGRLVPVVDVEYYGDKEKNPPEKEDVLRELGAFMDAVEAACGARPMIYTRPDIHKKYFEGALDDCRFWIASPNMPIGWQYDGSWTLWQYLNRGLLEGYSGGEKYIDLNVLNPRERLEDLILE